MVNKIVVSVLAVMVASIVLIATLPIYGSLSGTSVIVENEGAGELRFNLADNHAEYNISVTWGDDNIIVANGTDTQAISYDNPTILYADENLAVWYDGNEAHILAPEGDGYTIGTVGDDLTIVKNSSGLSVTIGDGSPVSYSAPAWAYIANSSGKYGYFEDGTEIKTPTNNRLAVVGSFAGVYCYNQYNNYDLPISLELTQEGNVLSGAKWVKALQEPDTNLEPFDPSSITITPLDPGDISITPLDPEPDVSIMSVPTPTYTEGDWGYDLVDGKAVIVSYSGTGGGAVTVPATIGGYVVDAVGKGTSNNNVIDTTVTGTDLIISEGITKINSYAFGNCSFTGNLVLPSTLTTLGDYGIFSGAKFTGKLVIPDGITTIGNSAFANTNFTEVIIPPSVTSIGNQFIQQNSNNGGRLETVVIPSSLSSIGYNAFAWCYNLKNIIIGFDENATVGNSIFNYSTSGIQLFNHGAMDITSGFKGLNSDADIRTEITALGYISAVEFTESTQADGAVYDLLNLVPLLSVFGLVLGAIAVFLIRRA